MTKDRNALGMPAPARGRPCPTRRRLAAALPALALCGTLRAAPAADEVSVRAQRRDRLVVLDIEATVAAPPDIVWAVLTDYDHMAGYMSAVKSSAVTRRDGERLEVAQSIEARVGPFRFSSSSVRAVELTPQREIRSTLVSGDFDTFVGTTRLVERGAVTAIVNHSEYAPKAWIPPLIGTGAIESETRKQYQQLLAEMVRRTAQRAAPAAR